MRRVQKLFRPSEIHTMGLSLLAKEQEAARARLMDGRALGGSASPLKKKRTGPTCAKFSRQSADRSLDRIAAHFNISGRQLEKIGDVCRAAEADPDRFGHLLEEMDRSGKVNGPHTKLLRLRDALQVRQLAPIAGRFRTLVFDVPWGEDNISDAAGHAYALMRFEEILALKDQVEAWTDPRFCHLWFWATNNTLGLACQAIEHFEFAYKTCHTWVKPNWGRGRYARNTTEHVLFAIRGDQGCAPAFMSTPTAHDWPMPDGPESTKPDGFYDMVRSLSFGPFGEAFQRTARPDFVNLYQPAPAPILEAAE